MITQIFDNDEAWKEARKGLITGTRAYGCKPKRGGVYAKDFWEILAERVCDAPDDENVMARGLRLEEEAIKQLEAVTGLEFEHKKVLWVSEEVTGLAVSPDATGLTSGTYAAEIKCLNSGHHLEAYFSKDYPKSSALYYQYKAQARQYFQVNPELETLYVGFYDPRSPVPFHYIVINRTDIEEELEEDRSMMMTALKEISDYEKKLIKF